MKKNRLHTWIVSGAMLLALIGSAEAAELDEACDYVFATLRAVKGASVTKRLETFTVEKRVYDGCTISLVGDADVGPDAPVPLGLLNPDAGSDPHTQGWRRIPEHDADGPDGSSFRIVKGRTFCIVEGRWDGGDDADRSSVPSTKHQTTVRCARVKE